MRRIVLPLAAVAAAYCAYLTTVPPPVALPAAAAVPTERVTCEITLPERTYYTACLGRYDDISRARVEAARLSGRGAAGNVMEEQGTYAVVGAVYDTQGEAAYVCRRIANVENIPAEVICSTSDAVRLRVTADEAQIGAMEDVIDILEEIPGELNTLSYDVDSGAKDVSVVRTLVAVLRKRADDALSTLVAKAGDTRDSFCLGLMEAAGNLSAAMENIVCAEGMNSLDVSSAMKNASVGAIMDISELMDNMLDGG